jgi:hypothetical protein
MNSVQEGPRELASAPSKADGECAHITALLVRLAAERPSLPVPDRLAYEYELKDELYGARAVRSPELRRDGD